MSLTRQPDDDERLPALGTQGRALIAGASAPEYTARIRAVQTGISQGVDIALGYVGNTISSADGANTIGGGGTVTNEQRITGGAFNTIAGGYDNDITSSGIGASTISGGAHHVVSDTATHGTIGGGSFGLISGTSDYSTISGGTVNSILSADQATVGGGAQHRIEQDNATIAGGVGNVVANLRGTAGGGTTNVVAGNAATISGGDASAIKGSDGSIGGGAQNIVGPCRVFIDAVTVAADQTVTSATGDFTGGDVGATVYIQGCGTNFDVHKTTIASINSATSIEVTTAPVKSRTDQVLTIVGAAAGADYGTVAGGLKNKAKGIASAIGGGRENIADISYSTVAGGYQNQANQAWATVGGGDRNVAAGTGTFVGSGVLNTATGNNSVIAGGRENTTPAPTPSTDIYQTVGGGFQNAVTGPYGTVPGGRGNTIPATASYAYASGREASATLYGMHAQASGAFSAAGDAQTAVLTVRRQTTDGTANTSLLTDNSAGRLVIPNDTTWAFSVLVVARRTDADNESAAYKFEGCIDNNANTVALVGAVTKTVLAEDTAAWECDASADNTNKALALQVTGEAAKTINWVGRVTLVQVTG